MRFDIHYVEDSFISRVQRVIYEPPFITGTICAITLRRRFAVSSRSLTALRSELDSQLAALLDSASSAGSYVP